MKVRASQVFAENHAVFQRSLCLHSKFCSRATEVKIRRDARGRTSERRACVWVWVCAAVPHRSPPTPPFMPPYAPLSPLRLPRQLYSYMQRREAKGFYRGRHQCTRMYKAEKEKGTLMHNKTVIFLEWNSYNIVHKWCVNCLNKIKTKLFLLKTEVADVFSEVFMSISLASRWRSASSSLRPSMPEEAPPPLLFSLLLLLSLPDCGR